MAINQELKDYSLVIAILLLAGVIALKEFNHLEISIYPDGYLTENNNEK